MEAQQYKCEFLTQDIDEQAVYFSERINERINSILKDEQVIGQPFCFPTSDRNGRKEVMIQYYVKNEENKLPPESILGLIFHLKNIKDNKILDIYKEGYELCIAGIMDCWPELDMMRLSQETFVERQCDLIYSPQQIPQTMGREEFAKRMLEELSNLRYE